MKEYFPVIIHMLRFLFQHELHQSTNMYNDDRNDNRIGRNSWRGRDNSFDYDIIHASM